MERADQVAGGEDAERKICEIGEGKRVRPYERRTYRPRRGLQERRAGPTEAVAEYCYCATFVIRARVPTHVATLHQCLLLVRFNIAVKTLREVFHLHREYQTPLLNNPNISDYILEHARCLNFVLCYEQIMI